MTDWPTVELDPVARLRILARALPHVHLVERSIDAPVARVWSIAGDLEDGVPRFETLVRRARVLARDGERLQLEATSPFGATRFDVLLRPGFCVMHGGSTDIGMAAASEGAGTRFAHFEGHRRFGRFAWPYLAWSMRRELARLARLVERGKRTS